MRVVSPGDSGMYVEKTGAGALMPLSVLLHDAVSRITAHVATVTVRKCLIVCRNLPQGNKKLRFAICDVAMLTQTNRHFRCATCDLRLPIIPVDAVPIAGSCRGGQAL